MDELEKAHDDYEKRREEVIGKLHAISLMTENYLVKQWLKEIIEFVKEREV